ncbi:DegT/DnrJ/EryC1/StrS aminotransferase family protein [Pelagibacteraceae bacterium]|nr:DegT/DnrJ/EryC1/StrS aminotransferase family protein [Pelagibacteraceae bacterium]
MSFPLIQNNITKQDLDRVRNYLKNKDILLTQAKKVKEFETKWSKWLGVKYSTFVNSGSSANLISMAIVNHLYGKGEVIVPALTWVSDVASIIQNNLTPRFVDINLDTLSMSAEDLKKKINKKTKAIFITHAQGFNGFDKNFFDIINKYKIPVIEDVCESHGAKYKNKKLGSFGLMSNFSFYYAHHMSTIEGGMICTNDENIYELSRMFRSHGLVREINNKSLRSKYINQNKNLNPQFIFQVPGYNLRSNEISAIIGINQLKRLDNNIKKRNLNHEVFLKHINKDKFFVNFKLSGSSNYAFNLILKNKDNKLMNSLMQNLTQNKIEFRKGSAGGGNQLRQPYLKSFIKSKEYLDYLNTEHVHFFGMYIGNYPDLKKIDIIKICTIINKS